MPLALLEQKTKEEEGIVILGRKELKTKAPLKGL